MADKGNLYLKNSAVIDLYKSTKTYETITQEALYSQYKNAFKISKSNYFRGNAADSFKSYVANGTINIISGLLDISSDISMIIQLFAEVFCQYEHNQDGKVEENVLDYINQVLISKENTFEGVKEELNAVLRLASKYIATKGLSLGSVNTGYIETRRAVKKIREDLYAVDDEAVKYADELLERIRVIQTLIQKVMVFCYNDDGKMIEDNLDNIQNQDWFQRMGNVTLYLMLEEDPFEYVAGEVTLSENQWAVGLCSDVYAYTGYSIATKSWEMVVEDGTAFAKGKISILEANGYAQFTDYLSSQANVHVLYEEGEVKAGYSDEYKGFSLEGETGLIQADGSVVIGSDDINAFIKGEAEVLCADGKVAFEFQDDGEYAIGVDVSATSGSVGIKGGTTILSYKDKYSDTKEKNPLLGFSGGVKLNAGGSFAMWAESKTAIETEYVNINATTINIDFSLLAGAELSVTIPTPHFKWPW